MTNSQCYPNSYLGSVFQGQADIAGVSGGGRKAVLNDPQNGSRDDTDIEDSCREFECNFEKCENGNNFKLAFYFL